MSETTVEFEVGVRLDKALALAYPQYSRAYLARLVDSGVVKVNGKQGKAGQKLRRDDQLAVSVDLSHEQTIEDIELPILHEDENVLVINKPAGVISHSRGKYWYEPSVASFVRQKTNQEGDRSGIVHRLDRATSGVMICAKNSETLSFLQKQFSDRKVKKTYYAIISGHMKIPEAVIDMPIERNPKAPATFRVGPNGKESQTRYTVINQGDDHELVKLEPLTGRTHQLRVHLAYQKHPIVGDLLYNGETADRLYLHAFSLEITLPDGERKTYVAPLPDAFTTYGMA